MFIYIFQILKEITGKTGEDTEDLNITYILTKEKNKILDQWNQKLSLWKEYLSRQSSWKAEELGRNIK